MLSPRVLYVGYTAPPGTLVIFFSVPLCTHTDQRPESDPDRREKIMDLPSGDQLGKLSRDSGSCGVSSRGGPPLVETTQIVEVRGGAKSIGTSVTSGADRN